MTEQTLDRVRGSLVGGAAGDALGYAVEFLSLESIQEVFGQQGITEYRGPIFSDDTQMTLFTAAGITRWASDGRPSTSEKNVVDYVRDAYLDWLKTQDSSFTGNPGTTWLLNVGGLHELRAPGNTCLFALRHGGQGTICDPLNNSKGCGGVMRLAPWGLIDHRDKGTLDSSIMPVQVIRIGAEMAALTHGHPLGWIPAGILSFVVHECTYNLECWNDTPKQALTDIVAYAIQQNSYGSTTWFPESPEDAAYMSKLLNTATELANNSKNDVENISKLGGGWVGEEALAIAVYSALRYPDDFSSAIIAAANHSGDSDSTAAIAGNIVGAMVGMEAIEEKWTKTLELLEVILMVAQQLYEVNDDALPREQTVNRRSGIRENLRRFFGNNQ